MYFILLYGAQYICRVPRCAKMSCAKTALRQNVLRQNGRAKTAAQNCHVYRILSNINEECRS